MSKQTDRDAKMIGVAIAGKKREIEILEKALDLACQTIEGCPMSGLVHNLWDKCEKGYPECGGEPWECWRQRAKEMAQEGGK